MILTLLIIFLYKEDLGKHSSTRACLVYYKQGKPTLYVNRSHADKNGNIKLFIDRTEHILINIHSQKLTHIKQKNIFFSGQLHSLDSSLLTNVSWASKIKTTKTNVHVTYNLIKN